MDILQLKAGEIYTFNKLPHGSNDYYILVEPIINNIEKNKRHDYKLQFDDEFMILETPHIEWDDALWIHVLGVNREFIGWIYVWFNNFCDRANAESWERLA